MLKKVKVFLAVTLSAGALMVPAVTLAATDASIKGSLCNGAQNLKISDTATDSDCNGLQGGSNDGLNDLIAKIINIISVIVAVVAVIMIIFGGFKYITSGGDSGNVTGAKNTILYAIIGLVVVALAQFIVKFVLTKATDATQ